MFKAKNVLVVCFILTTVLSLAVLNSYSQVTDIDGNVYETVTIGKQIWIAANLNVSKFRNGDEIPQALLKQDWDKAGTDKTPVWCYYDVINNTGKEPDQKYGKLYNWYAVNDPRGLAPEGYHIPTDKEWKLLITTLGGDKKAGIKMKSTTGWNEDGNGTNESGFSALPAGWSNYGGSCWDWGYKAFWWSSASFEEPTAWEVGLYSRNSELTSGADLKKVGVSVRCVKN